MRNYLYSTYKSYFFSLLFVLLLVCFLVYKYPRLSDPLFNDDAWVYGPAIEYVADHEISFSPNAYPDALMRGHPLLFHITGGIWGKLVGISPFTLHLFGLLISLLLFFVFYRFGCHFFGQTTALASVAIFMVQSVVVAQSSFVLPEMMVSLLTLLCIWTYLEHQHIAYIFAASALLFTKESGIIVVGCICLLHAFLLIKSSDKKHFLSIRTILQNYWLIIPLFLISTFFIVQKWQKGWFFFPEHVEVMNWDLKAISHRLISNVFSYVFIYQGRNFIFFLFLFSIIVQLIKKQNPFNAAQKKVLLFFLIVSVLYMLFCSVNFYIPRYTILLIPLFILLAVHATLRLVNYSALYSSVYIATAVLTGLYYTAYNRSSCEHDLGYMDLMDVWKKTVTYCEKEKMQEKKIYTHFLMSRLLQEKCAGYISGKPFQSVSIGGFIPEDTDYYIFSSYEYELQQDKVKEERHLRLLKRIENKLSWCEIYKKP